MRDIFILFMPMMFFIIIIIFLGLTHNNKSGNEEWDMDKQDITKMLDWLVKLNVQHYKTESTSTYTPKGDSHFYLKYSPERFTSLEMIEIFNNQANDELMSRWNNAITYTN